jgi:probable HAF family extracellular repeat protein
MRSSMLLAASFVAIASAHNAHAKKPDPLTVTGLPDFAGGALQNLAYGVSADGTIITGFGNTDEGTVAFRWSAPNGMTQMGDLPGGGFYSAANGISGNGKIIVGVSRSEASGDNYEAFAWSQETGMIGLGDFSDGIFNSGAYAASYDGSVIVGWGTHASLNEEAMRWTQSTGLVGLGYLPGAPSDTRQFSYAIDVSASGKVVVGFSSSAIGTQAFRWSQNSGMVGLGGLQGAPTDRGYISDARAVSADGKTVVGAALHPAGDNYLAFKWTENQGMQSLGYLDTAITPSSTAIDVSADGKVVVGVSNGFDNNIHAVRWIGNKAPESIEDLLTSTGIDLEGRWLTQAQGVSADGTVIVGYGSTPNDQSAQEAWWAYIPLQAKVCEQRSEGARASSLRSTRQGCDRGKRSSFLTSADLQTSFEELSQQVHEDILLASHTFAQQPEIPTIQSGNLSFGLGIGGASNLSTLSGHQDPTTQHEIRVKAALRSPESKLSISAAAFASNSMQTSSASTLDPNQASNLGTDSRRELIAASASIERPFTAGSHSLRPLVAAELVHQEIGAAMNDVGSVDMLVDERTIDLSQVRLGLAYDYRPDNSFRLRLGAMSLHRLSQKLSSTSAVILPFGIGFLNKEELASEHSAEFTVASTWQPYSEIEISLDATSIVAASDQSISQAMLNARFAF